MENDERIREGCNLSLRGAYAEIGISPAYLSDLENDRRYPPVGEVLTNILKTYKVNEETEYEVIKTDPQYLLTVQQIPAVPGKERLKLQLFIRRSK